MSTEVQPGAPAGAAPQLPGPTAAGGLLERIITWAAEVVGAPHGYLCLIEPDDGDMVLRVGTGAYTGLVGLRMTRGEGLSGRVWESGEPLAIDDYSSWEGRVRSIDPGLFRAVLGVPLVSGCMVTGVLGLAFSEPGRTFSEAEVEHLRRFAELASVALDNARLYTTTQKELAERTRAEEELRRAEHRWRTLIEQLPALVYSEEFEVGGSRVVLNRQIEAMFGFTPEESGQRNFWKTRVHTDDLERVLAEEARCEATGDPFSMEYRTYHKNGDVRWIRDECVLVRNEDGRPLFWQGLVLDVTDTKRAEEATREALERERQAADELRALDEMKNTFLDAVSHELRTPLAAVIGLGITLEQNGASLAEDDRADLTTRLVANGRKLDRLLSDLLDLDRLSRGIVAPKRQPTDVAELANRVAAEWSLLNERRLEVDADPVTVCLDPGKVERIVENLLANAARHTPPDTPVWVRVRPAGSGVLLAVEDAGTGVPAEVRASVFEPFRRGPDAPAHAPGVGIGLTLVARFAQLHGGRAWVQERDGGGSSFRVLIPDGPPSSG